MIFLRATLLILLLALPIAAAMAADGNTAPAADRAAVRGWNELRAEWRTALAGSTDAEQRLLLAVLATDSDEERQRLFADALQADPRHPVTLWHAAEFCAGRSSGLCKEPWLERLLELEADNGAVWTLAATVADRRDRPDEALALLRRAAASARYDTLWTQQLAMFERGLRILPARYASSAEHYVAAFGYAASLSLPPFQHLVSMCSARGESNAEWRIVCRDAGLLMERVALTYMVIAFGQAVQEVAFEQMGEPEALAALETRRAERREMLLRGAQLDRALSPHDPFWHEWFETFVDYGEREAARLAIERMQQHEAAEPE